MVDHLVSWLNRRFVQVVQVLCTKTIVWLIVRVAGWCTTYLGQSVCCSPAFGMQLRLYCRSSCLTACSYVYAARVYYPWDTDASSLYMNGYLQWVNANVSSAWLVKPFWTSSAREVMYPSTAMMERLSVEDSTCYYRAFSMLLQSVQHKNIRSYSRIINLLSEVWSMIEAFEP